MLASEKGGESRMEYAAIRHFADKNYCFALEQGRFLIRLEVKKDDAARVVLHTQDKYLPLRPTDTDRKSTRLNSSHWS